MEASDFCACCGELDCDAAEWRATHALWLVYVGGKTRRVDVMAVGADYYAESGWPDCSPMAYGDGPAPTLTLPRGVAAHWLEPVGWAA